MDQTPIEPTRPKLPWTIIALIAIWVVAQVIEFSFSRPQGPFGDPLDIPWYVTILQFLYGFLIVALVSYGLMRRERFVWILAFVWQGIHGIFAVMTLNEYGWSSWAVGQVPRYGGTLPFVVAVASFILLLLPATQRWILVRKLPAIMSIREP